VSRIVTILYLCVASLKVASQDSLGIKINLYEQQLKKLLTENKLPSISFAIIRDQELVYSNAIGFANIEKKIPATDTTLYSIASLTKPIASSIILRLVEEKVLGLDDKMKDHWPGYAEYYSAFSKKWKEETPQYLPYIQNYQYNREDITVRHHLSHTAENIPGTSYRYNGFLFGGLSIIVDHVAGKSFVTLVREGIIDKLKMKHSAIDFNSVTDPVLQSLLSTPYKENNEALYPASYPEPHTLSAAAGFLSCVKDLAKFDIAIDQDKIMSAASKKLAMTAYRFPDGSNSPYGLGWFITSMRDQLIIYHYGLQESYSGIYIKIPGRNLTLIMLSNCSLLTMSYHSDLSQGVIKTNPYINEFLKLFL
jgi:CubicO group peptidase (beta-lactamase class C family)